ncbi:MAG: UDP-N-acetylmuramate--L-alanine ligase [Candidatus Brocadiia bacterium]
MQTSQNGKADFSQEHWHFVGILGTGMRALARYASERGIQITGSDVQASPAIDDLTRRGITIDLDQDTAHFQSNTNRIIVSQAIQEDNPELVEAHRLGVEVVKYPELLGELMDAKPGLAVTGSHGKSTTSAMVAYTMQNGGLDPSYLIGADVPQLGGGSHYGIGNYFVAEACEYRRSFLYLEPHIGVITNVDLEHTDYYYDLWDIRQAFSDFAEQIHPDGFLLINADDKNSDGLGNSADCNVLSFSVDTEGTDYRAERIWRAKKHTNFDLMFKGENQGRFSIKLYGSHNVYNALAAIGVCHQAGMDFDDIREHVSTFEGAARRLQLLGEPWNVAVLSDYAHHPSEIKASLAAAQQRFPKRRVFCIFQPHQYSRTRAMLDDFSEALRESWVTLITDIYAARDTEEDRRSVSAMDLVRLMNHKGMCAHYVPEFEDIEEIIVGDVVPEDVVLVMGAGNIWQVARNIVPRIEEKGRRQVAA